LPVPGGAKLPPNAHLAAGAQHVAKISHKGKQDLLEQVTLPCSTGAMPFSSARVSSTAPAAAGFQETSGPVPGQCNASKDR
jgi:hypothetical protein